VRSAVQGKIAEQGRATSSLVGSIESRASLALTGSLDGNGRTDGRDGFGLNQPCGFGGA
jgi:hypothetical protein